MENATNPDELRAEAAGIESEPSFDFMASLSSVAPAPTSPAPEPLPDELPPVAGQFDDLAEAESAREPFGRWLLAQTDRGDWIDPIAAAARKDPAFPKNGDPEAVRKHMSTRGADSDVFEALDDAELDWASY